MDQLVRIVLSREVAAPTRAVLPKTPLQIVCDTDVEDGVPPICEDVNEIILMCHGHLLGFITGSLDFARDDWKVLTAPAARRKFSRRLSRS